MFIFVVSVLLISVSALPYIYYLFGIKFGKKTCSVYLLKEFPNISIIISAYNEEKIISERIDNLAETGYPKDKFELIFIDDHSDDNTKYLAESKLRDSGINYRIFSNYERKGTNKSYNFALSRAKNNIIVTTDANKFFEADTLVILISRLVSDDSVAAVCADVRPFEESKNQKLGGMEGIYRNFYGRMCDWESANDSTYNFNGALVAFKKNIISSIKENRGADDANTAFEAIRSGYRAVYVIESVIYEKIPPEINKQYKQKVRRAKRLIEATLFNMDLLTEKRIFSIRFYPFRIMMYVISPAFFLSGLILFIISVLVYSVFVGTVIIVLFILFISLKKSSFISSFILNQFYLLVGLLKIRKNMTIWDSTSV
ncbi:glycosyltransferase [Methanoplanus endosymbiosus]|uniref:Glycosyltransferase n=1 Tax=Methanoplanus endosymbiosus TaxID=33865 RepID=A0A9E7PLN3_9EURY|nr:glycosyltransferase [Methanoplanus endosymbiosus]UUX91254.1 glycosyltransferase [Methanoplanus endosymbiosus]